jgi:hypothetical protein
MKRLLLRVVLALALATGAAFAAQAPASAVRHSGPNWVWFGPATWEAVYSTYGITITGGNGAVLDYGFSTTICSAGATWTDSVNRYFAGRRAAMRQAGWTFRASRITHPGGTPGTYRRQVLQANHPGRTAKRGVITFDYDFTTNTDGVNYCYQRSIARYSNAGRWRNLGPRLLETQRSLAYSGPGA